MDQINSFEDLGQIQTLGFRGEALSSLCAVATVVIQTATAATAPHGSKLSFDSLGALSNRVTIARQPGTTCQVTDLFKPFPVRYREFIKNSKKDYGKAVQLLYAYALTTQPVRFKVTSIDSKGKSAQVFATTGSKDLLANFTSLFGNAASSNLKPFSFSLLSGKYLIHGLLSKIQAGSGRSSGDRQFIFINNRPCQLAKVSKVFNEVYRAQFPNQLPMLVVHLDIPPDEYDVNLTPDKRTILLHREQELVHGLKASLTQFFELSKANIPLNPLPTSVKDLFEPSPPRSVLSKSPRLSSSSISKPPQSGTTFPELPPLSPAPSRLGESAKEPHSPHSYPKEPCSTNPFKSRAEPLRNSQVASSSTLEPDTRNEPLYKRTLSPPILDFIDSTPETSLAEINTPKKSKKDASEIVPYDPTSFVNAPEEEYALQSNPALESGLVLEWEWIVDAPELPPSDMHKPSDPSSKDAHYTNTDNIEAEHALGCQLDPAIHFNQMEIIGQFNLGFIVVRLDQKLFIVDQHAADEIYHYTQLHQATPASLARQPLAVPRPLHLSIADELIALDNLDLLKSQGYDLTFSPSNPPGQRLKLLAVPLAASLTFDPQDLDRLIHSLASHPTLGCNLAARGGKLDAKLASQACRRSVMIGDPLGYMSMIRIVRNLALIPRPWNCPHGRPTLRHLATL
ncbi:ATP-binding mismatch repair protein, variant 2 [Entomophthora muscae]|uniref:ATP-binding mismatch repair protein, variant 2 n=1 Tax=Entomophthora muscae TaxID=34485 RepID=A0ACC2SV90_9FUNG|nr:ATP-binding mismatch repair protein, variant 2 [Entomophthora muscae]